MGATAHGWPMVKLGDLLTPAGRSEKITDTANETFVTLKLHGQGATRRTIGTGKTPRPFTGYRVSSGQFMYSRIDARNGAFAIIPVELDGAVVSKDFPVFEISDRLDPPYLSHYSRSGILEQLARSRSDGATNRQRVKEDVFLDFKIPLPPLDEQRRIARILDQCGTLVGLSNTALASIKSDFYRSVFTSQALSSAPLVKVSDIASVATGATPKRSNPDYYGGSIPWVKSDALKGKSIHDTTETITETGLNNSNCKIFRTGTTLIAMYGQGQTRGRAGYLEVPAATNQACAAVSPYDPSDDTYVFRALDSNYEELRALGRGGTQPNLNLALIKNFTIPYPAQSVRQILTSHFHKMDVTLDQIARRRQQLEELHRSLSARAFRGEL